MIEIRIKEHNIFYIMFLVIVSLLGVPYEYSWQCNLCKKWEWGNIYRFQRAAFNEFFRKRCIKHQEVK